MALSFSIVVLEGIENDRATLEGASAKLRRDYRHLEEEYLQLKDEWEVSCMSLRRLKTCDVYAWCPETKFGRSVRLIFSVKFKRRMGRASLRRALFSGGSLACEDGEGMLTHFDDKRWR